MGTGQLLDAECGCCALVLGAGEWYWALAVLLGCWAVDTGYWALGSDAGFWVLVLGCWALGTGTGHWCSAVSAKHCYWVLCTGYWYWVLVLASGCWTLVLGTGCCARDAVH